MIPHIFLLSKYVSTLFLATATMSCFDSLAFVIVKFARLVASDVMVLVRLFRASAMCDYSTWG